MRCFRVLLALLLLVIPAWGQVALSGGVTLSGQASLSIPVASSPTNALLVTNTTGSATSQTPWQFARPFAQGEITQTPLVLVDGTGATAQSTVKTRWSDGSVQHAIFHVLLPAMAPGQTLRVTFQDGAAPGGPPVSVADLLATSFDSTLSATFDGQTTPQTVSVRTMLQNGHCTPWLQGPVALSVFCADHSTARVYDLGGDSFRSLRPLVWLTYYPATCHVWVRWSGENNLTEAIQDIRYSFTLAINGVPLPTQAASPHWAGSQWTKAGWTTTPPAFTIDHTLAYLTSTLVLPPFNPAFPFSAATNTSRWNTWIAGRRELLPQTTGTVAGHIDAMGSTDWGRTRVALLPGYSVDWLYSTDPRMAQEGTEHAEYWPYAKFFWREGLTTKWFDRAHTVNALGRVLSPHARPTLLSSPLGT